MCQGRQSYHTSVRNKYFQENVYREKFSLICANVTVHCDTVYIQIYTENKNITIQFSPLIMSATKITQHFSLITW